MRFTIAEEVAMVLFGIFSFVLGGVRTMGPGEAINAYDFSSKIR